MFAKLINRKEVFDNVTFKFKNHLLFEIDANDIKGGVPVNCELSFTEWSPDRNQNQNSKYWSVVGDIARITGASKTEIHNQLLNDYGELDKVNGEPVMIVMDESFNYLTDEDLHLMPTGKTMVSDGKTYCIYFKLKNSRNLTRKEFSRLLDGANYEKEQLL